MSKVLVIGEYCFDIFIYCDTQRLSPEAPVPVLIPVDRKENMGMAGNVVKNIKSILPNDKVSGFYQTELITKTRYIDKKSNHMFIRVDEGEQRISKFSLNEYEINYIKECDIVVVSDYHKGYLTNDDLEKIGKLSKLSILDSKRKLTKKIVDSYTFVKLNEFEAKNNEDLMGCQNIIITLGGNGAMYQGIQYKVKEPQETIDVSGAGDTFTSAFIVKYYQTNDVIESILFANHLSSIVVKKRGVTTPI